MTESELQDIEARIPRGHEGEGSRKLVFEVRKLWAIRRRLLTIEIGNFPEDAIMDFQALAMDVREGT